MSTRVEQTLEHYDIAVGETKHIDTLWNTVVRITAHNGREYALRLCNPSIADAGLVRHELAFMQHVAELGAVRVPSVVPNRSGERLTVFGVDDDRVIACLFDWIEGEDLRGRVSLRFAQTLGKLSAHLHQAAQSWHFPIPGDGIRETYRWDEKLVDAHHEWIDAHATVIGSERSTALHRTVDRVGAQLAAIPKTRETYGFIHADLHQGNFISNGDAIAVIDFDQLGRGHYAYDLASLRTELTPEPAGREALWSAVKEGYSAIRPLPFSSDDEIAPFEMAGELGFLDWYYNSPNPDVRERLGGRFEHALSTLGLAM